MFEGNSNSMAYVSLPYCANEFEKLVVVSSLLCVHAIRRRLDMDVDAGGSAVLYFRLRESIIWMYTKNMERESRMCG